jgi:ParB family transcriptional regulator, chromosome partitioning protein
MMANKLIWTTIRVPLGNLIEWDKNPATISEKDAKQLARSLDKFDHVLPYVAAAPKNGHKELPLLDGHQRKMVELSLRKVDPKTLVDVRVPSRPLKDKERAELSIRLRRNVGQWDGDALLNWFESDDLLDWGMSEDELKGIGFQDFIKFEPVSVDKQGRLDQKSPVVCPKCKHEFVPK